MPHKTPKEGISTPYLPISQPLFMFVLTAFDIRLMFVL